MCLYVYFKNLNLLDHPVHSINTGFFAASNSEQELIKHAEIQIKNYLNEVKQTLEIGLQHTVHKRSTDLTINRINGKLLIFS